uniref:riboflavin kinase n=2 Tax=Dunaliella tertiolecta TaxID=3047 RepID=A0A7S3VJV5_DUNTE|mmetsp:Transcript_26958/g.72844  ORF Transcript_26958/g.72844 Transcript_26958/m.72844 type:complete len:391 (-) Transcript_26958:370-1542(-)|eukprot:CAMPEP_0202348256 /NCGR_PEP_ID=MMETSP1126-20121109/6266_1 /ASSEMBLY_ACC=CAM_ASM_000457 /TAXON_ID=3047 /ORGANISM="Dunaliella tertiolecta, Strain CCMP1320" /LENGTH=390 /DNA_ID=CAMNT_0048939921 /DNA_START=32 /DNA_END=1204 /DNA_ORIENTATION=+
MTQCTTVILDLDGTLLDTESLCLDVASTVLEQEGKVLTNEAAQVALGKKPLDCWRDVARVLNLSTPPEELLERTEALLKERWSYTKRLPGALRLVRHLACHSIPYAVATSTPRQTFEAKMAGVAQHPLQELLKNVVCGDEVPRGKPAPDTFLAAAKLLGSPPPEQCLVLEDSPAGAQAAKAAGMKVVGISSNGPGSAKQQLEALRDGENMHTGLVDIVPSLLAFEPQRYGLPPFDDLIGGTIPMVDDPIYIKGEVVAGFGRGSKELGIPTANVASEALRVALSEAVTGIYAGFASVGSDPTPHKMVMSIGYNPFYGNTHKTAEPWILSEFPAPFYGLQIRLVVCSYIRPEANFTSLQALIDRIHEDANQSRRALDHPQLSSFSNDVFLKP